MEKYTMEGNIDDMAYTSVFLLSYVWKWIIGTDIIADKGLSLI